MPDFLYINVFRYCGIFKQQHGTLFTGDDVFTDETAAFHDAMEGYPNGTYDHTVRQERTASGQWECRRIDFTDEMNCAAAAAE